MVYFYSRYIIYITQRAGNNNNNNYWLAMHPSGGYRIRVIYFTVMKPAVNPSKFIGLNNEKYTRVLWISFDVRDYNIKLNIMYT